MIFRSKPDLSLPLGDNNASTKIAHIFTTITNILTQGPSIVGPLKPISLTVSTDSNEINAYNIIKANKDFIVAEVIAYIGNTYPAFSYNQSKCERDTGLIVDAIAQDLLFQTNSQSTFTGLQYWSKDNYTGKIGSELTITVEDRKSTRLNSSHT